MGLSDEHLLKDQFASGSDLAVEDVSKLAVRTRRHPRNDPYNAVLDEAKICQTDKICIGVGVKAPQSLTEDGNTRTCKTDQGCLDMRAGVPQCCTDDSYETRSDFTSASQTDEECIDEVNSNVLRQDDDQEAGSTAALMLKKVHHNLSDSAVMATGYNWWNVIEGAILRETSEQFYANEEPQTAAVRWTRLKAKAAKVGHGLSKDEKARKLAVLHWLEAIDPKHRYGHNLHLYYEVWRESETHQPFFYWLDAGEGRDLSVPACSRSKLQKQQITYLGPEEREQYEVVIENGKLIYKQSRKLVNTLKGDKWIFVMSPSNKLYVHQKEKGRFQHSSFLAGGAIAAAGRLVVEDGDLELLDAHSGHYHPTEENFNVLVDVLVQNGADLSMAKPVDRKGRALMISRNRSKARILCIKIKRFLHHKCL